MVRGVVVAANRGGPFERVREARWAFPTRQRFASGAHLLVRKGNAGVSEERGLAMGRVSVECQKSTCLLECGIRWHASRSSDVAGGLFTARIVRLGFYRP